MARKDYFSGMKSTKGLRKQPFFSIISFCFYHFSVYYHAKLLYYHANCLYKHGNPYIITKTHRQFPCSYKGFACEYRLLRDSMEFCLIVSEFPCPYLPETKTPLGANVIAPYLNIYS